ncbi:hypothetical protein PMAYCL1PPCAC_03242 [Pristionchus mayeri]|uniref:Uncharacterized protein n=1 Tax=Pristionchus mayeri TaxID=1317129 RepID=A0AAN5C7T0_9BILA|nr:hypothetical protein PMAYCL1PPCAC_03242 [Pristionchus mayeri]
MSGPTPVSTVPGSAEPRIADAKEYIDSISLWKIRTKLRSTDKTTTELCITETKRFGDEAPTEEKITCGSNPHERSIDEESFGSQFEYVVTQTDVNSKEVIDFFKFVVYAELSPEEYRSFLENIEHLVDPDSLRPARFYRNSDIHAELQGHYGLGGIHPSGHRASPLFLRFEGVYLSCRLELEEDPRWDDDFRTIHPQDSGLPQGFIYPPKSPYGTARRSFNTEKILNGSSRLFLGGIHCFSLEWKDKPDHFSRPHYILLIVCKHNSDTFQECVELGLIELDFKTNNFMRWDAETGELFCATALEKQCRQRYPHSVWPEIFLADSKIPLRDGLFSRCSLRGASSEQKSLFPCDACHGYMDWERENNDESSTSRKRFSSVNSEQEGSPSKKPLA